MPWKRVTNMSERKAFIEEALAESSNISKLCSNHGISRKTGYKWLKRLKEEGPAGLVDRSRRPRNSPKQVETHMESSVLAVRQEHPAWGGRKIRRILQDTGHHEVPAASTITMILRRNMQIDPQETLKHKTFQRYEHEHPNDLWQMDYKGNVHLLDGGICHPLTVLDDHSRFLLGLKACPNQKGTTVQYHLTAIFEEFGLPNRMLMDNGSPWGDDLESRYTRLTTWLLRLGISISHGRPFHPQTQGKDERLHRTLEDELITRTAFPSLLEAQSTFDNWRQTYNFIRPHEALQMNTPASRYQSSPRPFPASLPKVEYKPDDIVRRTDEKGAFFYAGRRFRIGKAFPGLEIGLRPTDEDGILEVYYCNQKVAKIDLTRQEP